MGKQGRPSCPRGVMMHVVSLKFHERKRSLEIHTHLHEMRKLQLTVKTLVHTGVDFYLQNALNITHERI